MITEQILSTTNSSKLSVILQRDEWDGQQLVDVAHASLSSVAEGFQFMNWGK